ncbi:MAG TPA: hypothetical protein DCM08_02420 [Microscillaceae bacterium]|jgi:integral membrane protein|nr:hypothetical protein [Microscillaceae bacterium]
MQFLFSTLGRFRLIAFLEGISYILLLFVAMPLKYALNLPAMVQIVGMAHGILFVAYVFLLISVIIDQEWSILFGIGLFVASLLPFGTFYADAKYLSRKSLTQS